MFRVPLDAVAPSFDQTMKVSFWRWLSSSKADRVEWMRRRNAAAEAARVGAKAEFGRLRGEAARGVAEERRRRRGK